MNVWLHNKITSPRKKIQEEPISDREIVIVHSEYNRHNTERENIREIWNETMGLLEKDSNKGGLGIKQVILAHARPRNLKDLLQRAKLYEKKGP